MDITPDSWLAAAIDSLRRGNTAFPFKALPGSTTLVGDKRTATVRVLNQNTGEVWRFECSVERGPA
jgi:hypothetical protein